MENKNDGEKLTTDKVFRKISNIIINQTRIQKEKIKMDSNFQNDLKLGAMDILDITVTVEREFQINFNRHDIIEKVGNFKTFTVQTLADLVIKTKN